MILLTHLGEEMAIFMLAIILGSLLATKTQQSALVGQIILGIIIGPAVLGLVSYNEVVQSLSELGIILLIFLVGLECKFREVYTTKNLLVAISSAGVTWGFGFGIAFLFGFTPLQGVFIATAIVSTSTAVVAGLLRDTGKIKSTLGKTIMGVSAIDDMIGLIIFSIVIKSSDAPMGVGTILLRILIAIIFILVFFKVGKLLSGYLKKLEYWGIINEHRKIGFIFSLMIAFFFSSVSEFIGLSTMMGAFVAGLSLERIKDRDFKIGAEYLEIIFGSIFFVSLGLLVTSLLDPVKHVFLVVCLLAATVLGKVIGGYISLRTGDDKFSKKESVIIGLGLSPIGEIAALAALFALQNGILSNEIYSSIIFVSILSSILIPVVLVKLLNVEKRHNSVFKIDIKHKKSTYI